MIKKSYLLLFLYLTTTSISIAQDNNSNNSHFKTSKTFKVFDFDHNFYVSKNQEIVVLKFIRNHCIIQKFDTSTPELIKENKYSDFFPSGFNLESLKEIEGKYYFFYSLSNKNKKCDEIYAQEVDFEKVEFINHPKLILSSRGKRHKNKPPTYLHVNRLTEEICYEFIQPSDKSNLLIKYYTTIKDKESSSIELTLIDKNLSNIFTKSIQYSIDNKKNLILSNRVDNKGNFYFVSKKIIEKNDTPQKIYFNTVKFNSINISEINLNIGNKFTNELWIKDFKDEIFCGGFTSDFNTLKESFLEKRPKLNDSNEIVIFKINSNGEILENYKFNFPENIINFYKNQNQTNYVNNLFLHDFDILETGEIFIIGEQYIYDWSGKTPVGIYGDVLICKINYNRELSFIKRLPKIQYSANEMQPFSFRTFYTNDYIYLPFIDALKNLDPEKTKITPSGGDLILSRISLKNGDISRKFILNIGHKGEDLNKFSINRFYKSNLNSFSFDAYIKNKEDVLISVELN